MNTFGVNLLDFVRVEFHSRDVAFFAGCPAAQIQSWTFGGYLKAVQRGIRKDRLYTLHEVVKAVCMANLPTTPLSIASSIGNMVANRAECLISEGSDFEPSNRALYCYVVHADGTERGVYVRKSDLVDVFLGKKKLLFVDDELELRIFECDEMIIRALEDYKRWRKKYPLI